MSHTIRLSAPQCRTHRRSTVRGGNATRPMRWGVTYSALLFQHGLYPGDVSADPESSDATAVRAHSRASAHCCAPGIRGSLNLALLWGRTRLPARLATLQVWKASSYSPLTLDLPRCPTGGVGPRTRYPWQVM